MVKSGPAAPTPDDVWSTADAKARLSEVLVRARSRPQRIQRSGRDVAVVVSVEEMDRLRAAAAYPVPTPMQEFLRRAEELRAEGAMDLEIPPRRGSRGRRLPRLGA